MTTPENTLVPWKVRVLGGKTGAVISGRRVHLTQEQHKAREHLLGPWADDGWFDANGLTFKAGEELTILALARRVVIPEGLNLANFTVIEGPK